MKTLFTPALITLLGILSLSSCASPAPHNQDEAVLLQAGFQPVLPETVTERNAYNALPPYTLQQTNAPGKMVYAYRNESEKVTYVGGELEHKRYQNLLQKKSMDGDPILTAQADQTSRGVH